MNMFIKQKKIPLDKILILLKLKIFPLIILLLIILIIEENNNNIKICLCTVGKLENNYIREFVEHYKKYNIDKIFIYDNNDINGEYFNDVLSDYIKKKIVNILNFRGIKGKQLHMFSNCYKNNYKKYNWLIFYDIDEFINLKNYKNIKEFLSQKKFNKCQSIYLNWVIHTDNNLIYYQNRSLFERFPKIYINKNFCRGKSIIKGNIEGITMQSTHYLDNKLLRCDGFGNINNLSGINCKVPDFNYHYIDHFYSKSTEEFIRKILKGDCAFGQKKQYIYKRIYFYFKFNNMTIEKYNCIVNKTHLKLQKLKEK